MTMLMFRSAAVTREGVVEYALMFREKKNLVLRAASIAKRRK